MANFAKNFTGIYKVTYQSGKWSGSAAFRYRYVFTPNPSDGFVAAVGAIFLAMAPGFFDNFDYVSGRIIPANQTEGYQWIVPDNAPDVRDAAWPVASVAPEDYSFIVNYQGRNGTSRGSVYFGGCSGGRFITNSGPTPWRTTSAEWSTVANTVAALNAAGLAAPNNQHATFDPYANYKYNDVLVTKSRKGV